MRPFDHWFYLRFLLPAYPALFVLLAAAIRWIASKLPVEARVPAAALICAAMIPFGVKVAQRCRHLQVGGVRTAPRARRERSSRHARRQDAIVLSVQHSGSVRYYANRITLRYDWLKPTISSIPPLRDARRQGFRPTSSSTTGKRRSFAHASRAGNRPGRLDWPRRARDRQPKCEFTSCRTEVLPGAMKKGVLVFLLYCGLTVALTYPLILQMGSVLPNDAGDPALNTWILWWNTQAVPFSTDVVERASVLSGARRDELF